MKWLLLFVGLVLLAQATTENWGFQMFSIHWSKPGFEYLGDCHLKAVTPSGSDVEWNCTFFFNDTTPLVSSHLGKASEFKRSGSTNIYTFLIGRNDLQQPLGEWSSWLSSISFLPIDVISAGEIEFQNTDGEHWKCISSGCQITLATKNPRDSVEIYLNT